MVAADQPARSSRLPALPPCSHLPGPPALGKPPGFVSLQVPSLASDHAAAPGTASGGQVTSRSLPVVMPVVASVHGVPGIQL